MSGFYARELASHTLRGLSLDGCSMTLANEHHLANATLCTLTLVADTPGCYLAMVPKNARIVEILALTDRLPFIGLFISKKPYGGFVKVRIREQKSSNPKLDSAPEQLVLEIEIIEMALQDLGTELMCYPQT
jgi:hypothetical protein